MKRLVPFLFGLLFALLFGSRAHADAVADADKSVDEVMKDERFTFCKKPRKPFFNEQQALCPLADEPGCEAFAEACKSPYGEQPKKESSSSFLQALAPLLKILLYILVIAIVVAIAIPIINALLKARRNKKLADKVETPAKAVAAPVVPPPPELEEITDAEAALRMAEEHRRRGEYARALGLYLAAALTALDRRGAIRIAKHRTNGEYVRFCTDETSKPPLREIVREVDKVHFGKIDPTEEAVARVAQRAMALVRHTATTALTVLAVLAFTSGCNGGGKRPYDDPAGEELPLAVLKKHGFDVAPLGRSLASVPTEAEKGAPSGKDDGKPEILVIDVDRVPLTEEETQAHLMRYTEDGGVLVLFGHPTGWPKDLGAKIGISATARELVYHDYDVVYDWDTSRKDKWERTQTINGRVAQRTSVDWNDSTAIGWLGKEPYVVRKLVGKGVVYGIANDDLFTNVGILPKHNAAILVSIMKLAATDARILHPQAGDSEKTSQKPDESDPTAGGIGGRSQDKDDDDDPDQTGTRAKKAPEDAPGEEGKGVKVRHAQREDAIPPPSSPFAALMAAGLGKGTWHALAAAILLFLAFGIRHARPRDRAPQARRAFAEHVEATGAFWGRAKALPHALASYGKFVEMRLRERIPRGADPATFLATRAKVDPEHAAKVWKRASEAKDDDPVRGDELETIRELRVMLVKAMEST